MKHVDDLEEKTNRELEEKSSQQRTTPTDFPCVNSRQQQHLAQRIDSQMHSRRQRLNSL